MACFALDQTIYETSQLMPIHAQDRCGMVPIVTGYETPRWQSGEEYFSELSDEAQQEQMGAQYWEAWKAGKFEFRELAKVTQNEIWGPSLQVTPLKELVDGK